MNIAGEIRPGTNRLISGANILNELPTYFVSYKKIAVLTGDLSFSAFSTYYGRALPYPTYHYDGSVSTENVDALTRDMGKLDLLLVIGGGRVLDTGKLVAEKLSCDFFLIPTLISNCAAYTPIAVTYYPDHTYKEIHYSHHSPTATFLDWTLLLQTPEEYLIAGIGDTLAKWYEIEGLTRQLTNDHKTAFIGLGMSCAKEIRRVLNQDGEQAILDLNAQKATPAFGRICDTIVGLAGTVGGFAADYGRTAGAHAMHNGLSVMPVTHNILHGNKVAFGILVQLAFTNDFAEIGALLPFYQKLHLPYTLAQLGISAQHDREQLADVARLAASKTDSFSLLAPDITGAQILDAIDRLETFTVTFAE